MGRSRRSAPSPQRRASPSSPSRRQQAQPPARTASAQPPAHASQSSSGGMMSGLMGTVAQGMAFGTGSAMAHRAVGAVANSIGGSDSNEAPVSVNEQTQQCDNSVNVCVSHQKEFLECLNAHVNDISSCQFQLDKYNQCKQQSTYM
uniref:Uncharacterized protein AlNc14C295G10288 n=1 Tax=Albugo laibachii Nc14 TaxID=890382 RepID=F0WVE6_9STRA|nr:conserved hypothetical protein [Albugo laibachii Nc14]CCA25460.1 conserved hypothetical protein [Albugo laibachii Nc14]|eukprot:CCA25460.1 conserved hypothetical protein [Albugo laibachii Nc14]